MDEKKSPAARAGAVATRPEVFRRRLGEIEELVDTALRDEMGQSPVATELVPSLARAAEAALAFSAGLGRIVAGAVSLYTSPSPRDQRGSRMPSSA